ncbi:MAG: ABC transporter ATP-binding protein [Thermoanaerobaculia bacterium]
MNSLAIELRGVAKRYRHFALEGLDLELEEGQILGLIGPNGAGKSTTLRMLMGLVHADRGSVRVLGHSLPAEQVAAKREVGFVSEDLRLYGAATVAWHMGFVASIYPGWDEAYAQALLRRFDLKAEQRVKGLSHGQRVKAALLLALARRPRLLLLDEPTTGLDPVARQEVLGELMAVLADERRTILFSSHNTLDVEQISDQITFLDGGRVLDSADKESFLERWRRLRLELPAGGSLPALPGTRLDASSGRLAVVTTRCFEPEMAEAYREAGARVQAVEPMSLEEIFLAEVAWRRQGAAA